MNKRIDATVFKLMLTNGFYNLANNCELINDLNVFPVADGDTGTNMKLTLASGFNAFSSLSTSKIKEVAQAMSKGCLMGARGNSGVIISQYFKGFSNALSAKEDPYITANDLKVMFDEARTYAFKAVQNPVQGTILTVIADAYIAIKDLNINEYDLLKTYCTAAKTSLDNTPNLLPILKEANVVDSGAYGFLFVIEGMLKALEGEEISLLVEEEVTSKQVFTNVDCSLIKFGYCTEFILKFHNKNLDTNQLLEAVKPYGDSLAFVVDDDLLKVHIHTNNPGSVISLFEGLGDFQTFKIENMRIQHTNLIDQKKKPFGIIAVCDGEGFKKTFLDLGVDYIIEGGQSMNPSTNQFLEAVAAINSDNILILPNNKNVILAAEQATENSFKTVKVLKTTNMAEAYSLLLELDLNNSFFANYNSMKEMLGSVSTFQLTEAMKDTTYKGLKVHKGDIITLSHGDIILAKDDLYSATIDSLKLLLDESSEIVTFFYGSDVDLTVVNKIKNYLDDQVADKDITFDFIEGGQHIYSLIAVIE